jgi:hypothetical protein
MPPKRDSSNVDNGEQKTPIKRVHRRKPIVLSKSAVPPDVEITIWSDVYHLHSTTIRHNSRFFEKSLSDTWWRQENTHDRVDGIKYCYKLKLDGKNPELSMLEPVPAKPPAERVCLSISFIFVQAADIPKTEVTAILFGEVGTSASQSGVRITDASTTEASAPPSDPRAPPPMLSVEDRYSIQAAYMSLFRIFYNQIPDLPYEDLTHIQTLVDLADQYCCLSNVAGAIELLLFKQSGLKIAAFPIEFILLAIKIRSKPIYHDAFIHLVGKFSPLWERKIELPLPVRMMVIEEYHRIETLRVEVDRHTVHCCTDHNMSILDHWDEIHELFGPHKFGEGVLYRKLHGIFDSVELFMAHNAFISLCQLTTNHLQLDNRDYGHLTCAEVMLYPWIDNDDW